MVFNFITIGRHHATHENITWIAHNGSHKTRKKPSKRRRSHTLSHQMPVASVWSKMVAAELFKIVVLVLAVISVGEAFRLRARFPRPQGKDFDHHAKRHSCKFCIYETRTFRQKVSDPWLVSMVLFLLHISQNSRLISPLVVQALNCFFFATESSSTLIYFRQV